VEAGFFKGNAINNPKSQKRMDEALAHWFLLRVELMWLKRRTVHFMWNAFL
jgi:hypothetical protein